MKHSDVKDAIVDLLEEIVKRTKYINHHHPQKDLSLDIDLLKDDLRQLYTHFEYLKGIAQDPQLQKDSSGYAVPDLRESQATGDENMPAAASEVAEEPTASEAAHRAPEEMDAAGGEFIDDAEKAASPDTEGITPSEAQKSASTESEEEVLTDEEEKDSLESVEEVSQEEEEKASPHPEEEVSPEEAEKASPHPEEEVSPEEAEKASPGSVEEDLPAAGESKTPETPLSPETPPSPETDEYAQPVKEEVVSEDIKTTPAKNTVNEILSAYGKKTIGDSYVETDNSLNQRISENKTDRSIGARMQQQPVSSIKAAIGVNEKFLFINELFDGDIQAYNDAIAQLNDMPHMQAAFDHLNAIGRQFSWDAQRSSATIEKLASFVERRYM